MGWEDECEANTQKSGKTRKSATSTVGDFLEDRKQMRPDSGDTDRAKVGSMVQVGGRLQTLSLGSWQRRQEQG